MTHQLIKYDAACRALAEAKSVDEVKSWSDKAAAIQAYGRMAQDKTLEVDAAEIRIRAERRLGELLGQQKAAGGLNPGARGRIQQHRTGGRDQRPPAADDTGGRQQRPPAADETGGRQQRPPADGHPTGGRHERPPAEGATDAAAPRLADAGISKDLSARAQKLAAVPAAQFEQEVGDWRQRVSAEGVRVTARLERAGAQALRQQQGGEPAADDDAFENPAELMAEMDRDIRDLQAQVDAMKADDQRAQTLQWRQTAQVLERRCNEHLQTIQAKDREIAFLSRQLKRCGKAVGQDDPDQVAAAVEAFVRGHAPLKEIA